MKIVDVPVTVETPTGVKIHIDAFNNVTVVGQNQLKFKCEGDIDFDADNINMNAKNRIVVKSGVHLIHHSERIDINPITDDYDGLLTGKYDKDHVEDCVDCSHEKT